MGTIVPGLADKLSPCYYSRGTDPLTYPLDLRQVGGLSGTSLVALAAALITFERRDLAI